MPPNLVHPTPDTRHPTPDTTTPPTRPRPIAIPSRPPILATWIRRHPTALIATALILAARTSGMPALSDPTGSDLPAGWVLHTPIAATLLAPISTLWDGVSMLSRSRLSGFLMGLALAYLAWRIWTRVRHRVSLGSGLVREAATLALSLLVFVGFVVSGLAWNTRAPVRLAGVSAEEITIEVHAHTSASHDVRTWPVAGFDAAASRRWHQRAGVDLVFLTDHNTTRGWAGEPSAAGIAESRVCPGVEISAHGAHILVLGEPLPAEPTGYRGGVERRRALFQEVATTPGAVALASLPEYRRQVEAFVAEGVHGFEIVSASPKGNDFPRDERDTVIAIARRHGLSLVGANDQHGYGATPMVWNVMHLPGWRLMTPSPCAVVVSALRSGGPDAVRIVERTRLRVDAPLPLVLTPLGVGWVAWATMSTGAVVGWLVWIWSVAFGRRGMEELLRRRRAAAIMSTIQEFR